ncbi:MAG: OsmC family protein [Rhodospirillales bacterium]|nr:OsmC family protein [Rhodospirillales bacterium]
MDAALLRSVQAPLKQRYREDAESARVPARAEAQLNQARLSCRVVAEGREVEAGLHPAAGGDGSLACSADMLMQALAACAGVTLAAVATATGIALRSGRIIAEGEWDARGTLAVDRTAPIGLTEVRLTFELDTDADVAGLERLIATTERYCVILQTLRAPPRLAVVQRRVLV